MRSIYAQASLLLFFFFLSNYEAQGISLGNGIMTPVGQLEKTLDEESSLIEEGFRKITLCGNGHCNSGNNRKLLTATSTSSPSPPTATNEEEEGNDRKGNPMSSKKLEEESVKEKKEYLDNSDEAVSENLETGLEHYPNLVDIAEMDYSPAKRKPPIHN